MAVILAQVSAAKQPLILVDCVATSCIRGVGSDTHLLHRTSLRIATAEDSEDSSDGVPFEVELLLAASPESDSREIFLVGCHTPCRGSTGLVLTSA